MSSYFHSFRFLCFCLVMFVSSLFIVSGDLFIIFTKLQTVRWWKGCLRLVYAFQKKKRSLNHREHQHFLYAFRGGVSKKCSLCTRENVEICEPCPSFPGSNFRFRSYSTKTSTHMVANAYTYKCVNTDQFMNSKCP